MSAESPYAPPVQPAVPPPMARTTRSPSPLVAAILSFCATGVGHVYAGRTRRGTVWALLPVAVLPSFVIVAHAHGAWLVGGMVIVLVASGAAWIAAIVDAARVAARSPARAPIARIVLFWIALVVATVAARLGTRRFGVEAYKVPSGSMLPAIVVGDHILVDKSGWKARRGDVIVFPFPERPDQAFVKRVIGFPGDRIEFSRGHPIRNGVPIPSCRLGDFSYHEADDPVATHEGDLFVEVLDGQPYFAFYDRASGAADEAGPWTVKEGEVFVVGDNRNNAHDSRMWYGGQGGGVPIDSVRGRAMVVWLSVTEGGIDWSRTGQSLDELRLPRSAAALEPAVAKCLEQLRAPTSN